MQEINIPFNGTNLDLSQIPDLMDNIVDWHLQLNANPPIPPNLFTINIYYLDNNDKKVLSNYVNNGQNIQTDITNISDQIAKASILLYFCNLQKVVKDDVDVIIRRPPIGTNT